ncbi:unnamed protein product [Caenorhabditis nigoni]|uniref:Uncharacterized protein n=1 Tax=Caenorhabditis nigoni TaxID=1611254 RepID=A0A2G5SA43_9PELO|nr:hypothetical protein B9Z55_028842 [Caenorhabditis nigoni]
MALPNLQEAIWFKIYLILMVLYQKLQSRLQMVSSEEGSFKLRSIDMIPVPEVFGFTTHPRIPNMKEWVMYEENLCCF